MSFPNAELIRQRIQDVSDKAMRMCFNCLYLYAGRVSEVVGEAYKSDDTVARGPTGLDVNEGFYLHGDYKEKAIIFTVRTAKRKGVVRNIGVPIGYEPLAMTLFEYFKEFGKNIVFPFTRQDAYRYSKEHETFKGLIYPIERYTIWEKGRLISTVEDHNKPYTLHAIRHTRATELVEFYGFDGFNLAAYGGWTISVAQSMFGARTPRVFSRYLYLNWQGYFPKLLKRRPSER